MSILVGCTCGKQLRVKNEHVGKKVKCPSCAEILEVPVPAPTHDLADDEPDARTPGHAESRTSAREDRSASRPAATNPSASRDASVEVETTLSMRRPTQFALGCALLMGLGWMFGSCIFSAAIISRFSKPGETSEADTAVGIVVIGGLFITFPVGIITFLGTSKSITIVRGGAGGDACTTRTRVAYVPVRSRVIPLTSGDYLLKLRGSATESQRDTSRKIHRPGLWLLLLGVPGFFAARSQSRFIESGYELSLFLVTRRRDPITKVFKKFVLDYAQNGEPEEVGEICSFFQRAADIPTETKDVGLGAARAEVRARANSIMMGP